MPFHVSPNVEIYELHKYLLLFDIDGTLLDARDAGARAKEAVAGRLFGNGFTFDGMTYCGKLDPDIFAEAAGRNGLTDHAAHLDTFRDAYLRELEAVLERQAADPETAAFLLPGIAPLLDHLCERCENPGDVLLGLVSGNYTAAAPIKLAAVGIDVGRFTINAFGDEAATRPDLVELAMQRYERATGCRPQPRRVIVVGDTPRDIACARAHGCTAFGVATGRYDVAALRAAGADIAVPNLADPSPLLNLLGGHPGAATGAGASAL